MVYPPENRECPSSSLLCSSGGAAFIVNPSSASSSFFSTIHPSCSNCPFSFLVPCCFHGNPNGIVRPLFPLLPLEYTLLPRFQSSRKARENCSRSVRAAYPCCPRYSRDSATQLASCAGAGLHARSHLPRTCYHCGLVSLPASRGDSSRAACQQCRHSPSRSPLCCSCEVCHR